MSAHGFCTVGERLTARSIRALLCDFALLRFRNGFDFFKIYKTS
ncbi:hypothetical protein CUS_6239 [Ruminococcus albus 8]|uniref:Uncharacterized protein n=1 Tax=Ruminococcus albus 8 TaxID=246199 RepID=E9S9C6_RUMAL|nr:hypothetical protein CUS_6239 [Ruminococcus albus 8]